jgi:hypothetical protein
MLRILAAVILGSVLGTGAAVATVATQSHTTNAGNPQVVQYGDRATGS